MAYVVRQAEGIGKCHIHILIVFVFFHDWIASGILCRLLDCLHCLSVNLMVYSMALKFCVL